MSMSIGVETGDFDKAARALEKAGFERQAGRTSSYAAKRIVNLVRRNVRAELRPHNKTGKMRDRVRVRTTGTGLRAVSGVRSTGSGSNLIVGGVRPHDIAGRGVMPIYGGKGAFGRGVTGGLGVEGFARAVHHPGFKADPFFHRGVEKSRPAIREIVQSAADTMAKELAFRMRGR